MVGGGGLSANDFLARLATALHAGLKLGVTLRRRHGLGGNTALVMGGAALGNTAVPVRHFDIRQSRGGDGAQYCQTCNH